MTSSPVADHPSSRAGERLGWIYTMGGAVGSVAAFVLLLERLRLLEDPTYIPTCSINGRLDCGAVMASDQADAFGFPNPIIGVAGFPVIVTIGVMLIAGVILPRWFRRTAAASIAAAVVFVHWLIVQSVLRIGALCPYCMAVWIVTIAIGWYTLLDLLPRSLAPGTSSSSPTAMLHANHAVGLASWYLAIAVFVAIGL